VKTTENSNSPSGSMFIAGLSITSSPVCRVLLQCSIDRLCHLGNGLIGTSLRIERKINGASFSRIHGGSVTRVAESC